MEQVNSRLIVLLEERLCNLKGLGQTVRDSQQACISADLVTLRTLDIHKEHLCAEIRRLDQDICALVANIDRAGSLRTILDATPSKETRMNTATAQRLSDLVEKSELTRAEVARLNRVYGQFLAGSRKTVTVMINVMSHCLGIYPSLGPAAVLHTTFERSY